MCVLCGEQMPIDDEGELPASPYAQCGYIAPGIAKVVNNTGRPDQMIIGKQIIAMFDDGTMLGPHIIESVSFTTTDAEWGAEIITIPAARSLTVPLKFIPPKTRREKRQ